MFVCAVLYQGGAEARAESRWASPGSAGQPGAAPPPPQARAPQVQAGWTSYPYPYLMTGLDDPLLD
jgi:hypothetical protein